MVWENPADAGRGRETRRVELVGDFPGEILGRAGEQWMLWLVEQEDGRGGCDPGAPRTPNGGEAADRIEIESLEFREENGDGESSAVGVDAFLDGGTRGVAPVIGQDEFISDDVAVGADDEADGESCVRARVGPEAGDGEGRVGD